MPSICLSFNFQWKIMLQWFFFFWMRSYFYAAKVSISKNINMFGENPTTNAVFHALFRSSSQLSFLQSVAAGGGGVGKGSCWCCHGNWDDASSHWGVHPKISMGYTHPNARQHRSGCLGNNRWAPPSFWHPSLWEQFFHPFANGCVKCWKDSFCRMRVKTFIKHPPTHTHIYTFWLSTNETTQSVCSHRIIQKQRVWRAIAPLN